jgi:hypothetical protein
VRITIGIAQWYFLPQWALLQSESLLAGYTTMGIECYYFVLPPWADCL